MLTKLTAEQKAFIAIHKHTDPVRLRLQYAESIPHLDFLIAQIKGQRKALDKLPEWSANPDVIYPKYLSMEQSSSEWTAKRKSLLFSEKSQVLDMTGGMGIDAFYISDRVQQYTLLELQEELVEINQYNFALFGKNNIVSIATDSLHFLENNARKFDHIYLDPARRNRDNSGRAFLLEDFRPNIVDLQASLWKHTDHIIVKLAPMLDISLLQKQLQHVTDIYVIAWKNEVKELVVSMDKTKATYTIHAINIINTDLEETFFTSEINHSERSTLPVFKAYQKYLYEPNKAILKAGLQDELASKYGLAKIAPNTHFYTSDSIKQEFQGRIFEIIQELPSKAKAFKKIFMDRQANIISRNHPLSAEQLASRFGLIMGGNSYILALSDHRSKGKILHATRLK